jgi:hypothetical protein
MTLRYSSGLTNVAVAGATLAHGLIGTPDEVSAVMANGGTGDVYFLGISQTNVTVAANGVAMSAIVQAAVNHTSIR